MVVAFERIRLYVVLATEDGSSFRHRYSRGTPD